MLLNTLKYIIKNNILIIFQISTKRLEEFFALQETINILPAVHEPIFQKSSKKNKPDTTQEVSILIKQLFIYYSLIVGYSMKRIVIYGNDTFYVLFFTIFHPL